MKTQHVGGQGYVTITEVADLDHLAKTGWRPLAAERFKEGVVRLTLVTTSPVLAAQVTYYCEDGILARFAEDQRLRESARHNKALADIAAWMPEV